MERWLVKKYSKLVHKIKDGLKSRGGGENSLGLVRERNKNSIIGPRRHGTRASGVLEFTRCPESQICCRREEGRPL